MEKCLRLCFVSEHRRFVSQVLPFVCLIVKRDFRGLVPEYVGLSLKKAIGLSKGYDPLSSVQ